MKSDESVTVTPPAAEIIDRGRGPEIKGTRITVYAVLDWVLECWPLERIAEWFDVTVPQVEAAVDYIREHTVEVLIDYVKILERAKQGNPPEVQAKIDASHQKILELKEQIRNINGQRDAEVRDLIREFRAKATESNNAGNHGG